MTRAKMFKLYMTTTCVSYTFIMMFQTILFNFTKDQMTNDLTLAIFGICLVVNLVIHITHYLELPEGLTHLISVIEIMIIVSGSNYLCGYTNSVFIIENLLSILIMSVAVYGFVMGIVFVKNSEDAKRINEKLKKNRHRN